MRCPCAGGKKQRDKELLLPARDSDGPFLFGQDDGGGWEADSDPHLSVTSTDNSGHLDPTSMVGPPLSAEGGLPQGFHLDWNQRWNLGFSETAGFGTHVVHVPWLSFVGIANGNDPQVFVCGDDWDGTAELLVKAVTASSIADSDAGMGLTPRAVPISRSMLKGNLGKLLPP